MKKSIICSLLFILSFVSISEAQSQNKGFYLGLNGSLDRSDLDVTGGRKDLRKSLEKEGKPKLGYTLGVDLIYRFNDKIAIETGVFYSNKGSKSEINIQSFDSVFAGGYIKSTSVLHYIDLPIKANFYVLRKRKIQIFLAGGLAANFLLKHHTKLQTNIPNLIYIDNTQKIGVSVLGSLGLDLPVTSRMFVRVEPIFRRSLTRISKYDGPIKSYLYNPGLSFGVYYKL
ncbi:MAG: PorT family protein [Sporocytophaga sp.]|uniref:porin family protein n=1 Tax=Sporocytophaga sp. TaxID=2231183 RepID=UPI001B0EC718|nr:porin family protein [Sporocytophaga sp.]MBO9702712.1 PorT family protein [Sporocytophaga sp.]